MRAKWRKTFEHLNVSNINPLLPPLFLTFSLTCSLPAGQNVSVTATPTAVTSPRGHGSPQGVGAGGSVRTADTTQLDASASDVALVTTAIRPCPSTPPMHAHVRTRDWGTWFDIRLFPVQFSMKNVPFW